MRLLPYAFLIYCSILFPLIFSVFPPHFERQLVVPYDQFVDYAVGQGMPLVYVPRSRISPRSEGSSMQVPHSPYSSFIQWLHPSDGSFHG